MSDVQRTRAALLSLFADNTTGQISEQDLRDFVVTVMESDFMNPGDFWTEPRASLMTSDKTVKGWIEYSQIMLSECSFGRVCYMTTAGKWAPASALTSGQNTVLGVAANSYAAAESQAQILRRGLVYDSSLSARFSGAIGGLVYLVSGLPGSVSVTANTGSNRILGHVEPSGVSVAASTTTGVWRFDPQWSISGV